MRTVLLAAVIGALSLLAGCGSSADSWADDQAARLADAGVTFPPDQERNTVITMVSACVMRDAASSDEAGQRMYAAATSANYDWITEMEASRMYDLADSEFCSNIPDGPLGEG